jgi:hypothetical protein
MGVDNDAQAGRLHEAEAAGDRGWTLAATWQDRGREAPD